jgi:hypothetical protein
MKTNFSSISLGLRARRKRPRSRTPKKHDEVAPFIKKTHPEPL